MEMELGGSRLCIEYLLDPFRLHQDLNGLGFVAHAFEVNVAGATEIVVMRLVSVPNNWNGLGLNRSSPQYQGRIEPFALRVHCVIGGQVDLNTRVIIHDISQ